jgi:DNA-binding transcriptional LysR family regulator
MAQSPLSQRIKSLEAELGVRLFERTNRRITVTDAGQRVLTEARTTLRGAHATRRAAERARLGETGVLRLGFVASAVFLRLPELLRTIRDTVPNAELDLLRLTTSAQVDALLEDRIDLGLARTPPGAPPDAIRAIRLPPEPWLAIVGTGHPIASRAMIRLNALAQEPWTAVRARARRRGTWRLGRPGGNRGAPSARRRVRNARARHSDAPPDDPPVAP